MGRPLRRSTRGAPKDAVEPIGEAEANAVAALALRRERRMIVFEQVEQAAG
jgi:hypothetical protein